MSRTAYYNELDPYCAQWLRNLIAAKLIAPGDVDERPIQEVKAEDLKGYKQAHFFAGIGGWSYALRLAGWPDDRPVWTGSCPCQPFSRAGKRSTFSDERHLWPFWMGLISERAPPVIFGEQIEAAVGWGWLDLVLTELEAKAYACGAAVLPACSVGAPHLRQRAYWVAHSNKTGRSLSAGGPARPKRDGGGTPNLGRGFGIWACEGEPVRFEDGSLRWAQPGVCVLADGVPNRMAKVGAFGNAIVPQVAAKFIQAADVAISGLKP